METLSSMHSRCLKELESNIRTVMMEVLLQDENLTHGYQDRILRKRALRGSSRTWQNGQAVKGVSLTDGTVWTKTWHIVGLWETPSRMLQEHKEKVSTQGNEMMKSVTTILQHACITDFYKHFPRTSPLFHWETRLSFSVRELIYVCYQFSKGCW